MPSLSSSLYSSNDHAKQVEIPSFPVSSARKYLKTRFSTLFVPKKEREKYSWGEICNPFRDLKYMSMRNWNFFFMGFAAWTWDSVDFFAVSLNAGEMAASFDRNVTDVTWGITLVLMLRTVGALLFGYWGDRYGRKWPYVVNLSLLVVLQIGTGFVRTYKQFLGVRAMFGIAMGGVYGFSLATSLDDSPIPCRGVLSGIFQQGYAFGYLLAVVFNRAITENTQHGWRALFWFAACPPVLFIIWRLCLPETDTYNRQRAEADAQRQSRAGKKWYEISEKTKKGFQKYWLTIVYCVLLMAGFNFMSHGSQDLYPTLLSQPLGYDKNRSTVINVVANLGAIFGGTVCGHVSTFVGRRLTILCALILGAAMVYPWAYTRGPGIAAGAFFMQAGVQGAWGVIPVYLSELAPPTHRSLVVGLSYQLGNMISSASATIESTLGEKFPIINASGEPGFDYAKVMSIFIACVFGYNFVVTFLGPENRGADLGASEAAKSESDDEIVSAKRPTLYIQKSASQSV
ncbi:MFS transporter, SHS family, lactate transporter [Metschnikowia aff. pulcherrima]|uniref:MFS transporter, SHS family, lactate transporter n=1 Tax=Metschnikowia aff. pulcherrima TaxID=2163413 RepID=A0A4P6XKQ7_9ASCO|nr:MFS transporter, SHS family, lactate transporter [Metschnikowia aff. pulcherrima]